MIETIIEFFNNAVQTILSGLNNLSGDIFGDNVADDVNNGG